MIRTQFFGEIIRFWSESQSYSAKVRVTAQKSELQPDGSPKSESNRPKEVSESDFGSSAEKGLKAFLDPPKSKRTLLGASQYLIFE